MKSKSKDMGSKKPQSSGQQQQAASGEGKQYGEGNYEATRQYNEGVKKHMDEAGVLHHVEEPMSGESWERGPVILSWADAEEAGRGDGYNVVVHEFAHKLDMLNGEPNGFPPLHADMSAKAWKAAFSEAYEDFRGSVDAAEAMPEHRVQQALDELPIDPYAAESPGEFFAVASEAFFETPELLAPAYPAVYEQLRLFYRQDPKARLDALTGPS